MQCGTPTSVSARQIDSELHEMIIASLGSDADEDGGEDDDGGKEEEDEEEDEEEEKEGAPEAAPDADEDDDDIAPLPAAVEGRSLRRRGDILPPADANIRRTFSGRTKCARPSALSKQR